MELSIERTAAVRFRDHANLLRYMLEYHDKATLVALSPVFPNEVAAILFRHCTTIQLELIVASKFFARHYCDAIRFLSDGRVPLAQVTDTLGIKSFPSPRSLTALVDLLPNITRIRFSRPVRSIGCKTVQEWEICTVASGRSVISINYIVTVDKVPKRPTNIWKVLDKQPTYPGYIVNATATLAIAPAKIQWSDTLVEWACGNIDLPKLLSGLEAPSLAAATKLAIAAKGRPITHLACKGSRQWALGELRMVLEAAPHLQDLEIDAPGSAERRMVYEPGPTTWSPMDILPSIFNIVGEVAPQLQHLKLRFNNNGDYWDEDNSESQFSADPDPNPVPWAKVKNKCTNLRTFTIRSRGVPRDEERYQLALTIVNGLDGHCLCRRNVYRRMKAVPLLDWLRSLSPSRLAHLQDTTLKDLHLTRWAEVPRLRFTTAGKPIHPALDFDMGSLASRLDRLRERWRLSRATLLDAIADAQLRTHREATAESAMMSFLNERVSSLDTACAEELRLMRKEESALLDGDTLDVGFDLEREMNACLKARQAGIGL